MEATAFLPIAVIGLAIHCNVALSKVYTWDYLMPDALDRECPNAPADWRWQGVFPQQNR